MPFLQDSTQTLLVAVLYGCGSVACVAQTTANAAPAQTGYAFCTSMNPATQTIYFSDAFGFSTATTQFSSLPDAFLQAVKLRDGGAANVKCTPGASLSTANQTKQLSETQVRSVSQSMAAMNGKAIQIVETGWRYPGVAAGTGTAAAGAGLSSVGNSVTASGKDIGSNLQNSMNQTVQGVEGTAVNTVTGSVNSMSNAAAGSLQNGMQNLQTKMFHHAKPAPAATPAPAQTAAAVPAVTTAPAATSAAIVPASLVATAAPTAAPAPTLAKPTIQDEGDGKHFILMLPGQADAHELTLAPGSKNNFLEDATGDKYIVMPSGEITHIPHKNVAK